jgi:hypothetical protein
MASIQHERLLSEDIPTQLQRLTLGGYGPGDGAGGSYGKSEPMAVPAAPGVPSFGYGYAGGASPPAACPVFFMSPRSAGMMAVPPLRSDDAYARAPACSPETGQPLAPPPGFCFSALMQKLSVAADAHAAATADCGGAQGFDHAYYADAAAPGGSGAVWQDGGLFMGQGEAAGADELAILFQQQASLDPAFRAHAAYAYEGFSYLS